MKILIPAKGNSKRCHFKNHYLLSLVSQSLGNKYRRHSVVISDDNMLLEKARKLGFKTFYSDACNGEHYAMYDYIMTTHYTGKWFIHLPLTQPLRTHNLIKKFKYANLNNCDFICSTSEWVDRTRFLLDENDKFIYVSNNGRKGEMCKSYRMIDGTIYKVKTKFLKKIIKTDNVNKSFWEGNFKTIENDMPFIDIDTKKNLKQLKLLINFNKNKQFNINNISIYLKKYIKIIKQYFIV